MRVFCGLETTVATTARESDASTIDAIRAQLETLGVYVTDAVLDLMRLLGASAQAVLEWLRDVSADVSRRVMDVVSPRDDVESSTSATTAVTPLAMVPAVVEEEEDDDNDYDLTSATGDDGRIADDVLEEAVDAGLDIPTVPSVVGVETPGFTNVRFSPDAVAKCRRSREKRRTSCLSLVEIDVTSVQPFFSVSNVCCSCPLDQCPVAIDVADAWAEFVASGDHATMKCPDALHRVVVAVATFDETLALNVATLEGIMDVLSMANGDEDVAFACILAMPTIAPSVPATTATTPTQPRARR